MLTWVQPYIVCLRVTFTLLVKQESTQKHFGTLPCYPDATFHTKTFIRHRILSIFIACFLSKADFSRVYKKSKPTQRESQVNGNLLERNRDLVCKGKQRWKLAFISDLIFCCSPAVYILIIFYLLQVSLVWRKKQKKNISHALVFVFLSSK